MVTENCINCKHGSCVNVCPTDAFREGPNFLVIAPDDCIDCNVCVAECPVGAIHPLDHDDDRTRIVPRRGEYVEQTA